MIKKILIAGLFLTGISLFAGNINNIDSPYGINGTGNDSPGRWDAITEAGIGWVRSDFEWSVIEKTEGIYDWSYTDTLVNEAVKRGLNLFISLDYCPKWASASDSKDENIYKHGPLKPGQKYLDAWHDFVYDAMDRYKGKVKYWGVWNEPNLGQFWNGDRDQFCKQIAYYAGKAIAKYRLNNPDAEVYLCGPELSTTTSQSKSTIVKWAKEIRENVEKGADNFLPGKGTTIDIVTMHQYDGRDLPEERIKSMDEWHTAMKDSAGYGDKPYWITESGWPTAGSKGVSYEKQAEYLVDMYSAMNERSWLKKFFWFALFDGNDPVKYGILANEGDKAEDRKPAWEAYKNFIHDYPNKTVKL